MTRGDVEDLREMGVRASVGAGAGGAVGAVAGTALCLLLGIAGVPVMGLAHRLIGATAAVGAAAGGVRAAREEPAEWKQVGDDLIRALAGGK